jgi:hypothetical protein
MQLLSELSSLLQPLGLSKHVEQHILYPGQRRNQLVQALVSRFVASSLDNARHRFLHLTFTYLKVTCRLLGGRDLDDLQLADAGALDGLPEDERFARSR